MNKLYPSAQAALDGIVHDGQLLAVGGFGLCGIPEALIDPARFSRGPGMRAWTGLAWASCSRRARSKK